MKNNINSCSKQSYCWTNEEDRITDAYITINPKYDYTPLPNFIELKDCQPGEVPIWKKRSFPKAARFHKKRENIDSHRYFLSELMLFKGFTNEKNLGSHDEVKCQTLYISHKESLQNVKQILLPYAQGVEKARYYVEEAFNEERSNIKNILDAEKEQEIAECQDTDDMHTDFVHLNSDELKIELKSKDQILEETRNLTNIKKRPYTKH